MKLTSCAKPAGELTPLGEKYIHKPNGSTWQTYADEADETYEHNETTNRWYHLESH